MQMPDEFASVQGDDPVDVGGLLGVDPSPAERTGGRQLVAGVRAQVVERGQVGRDRRGGQPELDLQSGQRIVPGVGADHDHGARHGVQLVEVGDREVLVQLLAQYPVDPVDVRPLVRRRLAEVVQQLPDREVLRLLRHLGPDVGGYPGEGVGRRERRIVGDRVVRERHVVGEHPRLGVCGTAALRPGRLVELLQDGALVRNGLELDQPKRAAQQRVRDRLIDTGAQRDDRRQGARIEARRQPHRGVEAEHEAGLVEIVDGRVQGWTGSGQGERVGAVGVLHEGGVIDLFRVAVVVVDVADVDHRRPGVHQGQCGPAEAVLGDRQHIVVAVAGRREIGILCAHGVAPSGVVSRRERLAGVWPVRSDGVAPPGGSRLAPIMSAPPAAGQGLVHAPQQARRHPLWGGGQPASVATSTALIVCSRFSA